MELERDRVMLPHFDPAVVGVSSKPFWLFWPTASGQPVSHAPDYLVRRGDGAAVGTGRPWSSTAVRPC